MMDAQGISKRLEDHRGDEIRITVSLKLIRELKLFDNRANEIHLRGREGRKSGQETVR
jgi:hypothetical protein